MRCFNFSWILEDHDFWLERKRYYDQEIFIGHVARSWNAPIFPMTELIYDSTPSSTNK